MLGNPPGDFLGDSLRQHAGQKIVVVAERFDELIGIAIANLCDRVFRNRVAAAVANGIALFIRAKANLFP